MEIVWRVSGRCLVAVWRVSRGCLEGIYVMSERYMGCLDLSEGQVWIDKSGQVKLAQVNSGLVKLGKVKVKSGQGC